jgi:N6-adenosine-specific RNA methylase IME4
MTPAEIAAYLPSLNLEIAPDALLFLWRVSALVPEAYSVVKAWGFVAKAELVWEKTTSGGLRHFGMGRYVRQEHETCIIAARGQGSKLIKDHKVRSIFAAPTGRHSEKPAEFFSIVERLVSGPFVELFARERRLGWTAFGDELPGRAAE